MRALVVDRNPERRAAIATALSMRGHAVVDVEDLEGALEVQQSSAFSLVVLGASLSPDEAATGCRSLLATSGEGTSILAIVARIEDASVLVLAGIREFLVEPYAPHLFELRISMLERTMIERGKHTEEYLLTDRMVSVGTLAAGVAHEINNPLAYLIANLGFISEELGQLAKGMQNPRLDEIRSAVQESREGAERMRLIVRDLKAFSRADDDHRGPVDVRRVIESSINMAWNEIRHRARLVKDYAELPIVEANESRLGQVFLNLLINAAQAIPDGDAARHEIRIVTRAVATSAAIIEVHDTGTGIAPEIRDRIFDPFFTTKPVGVGTGLGLSICHGIITRLGGTIEIESELGKGSVFRVILPASEAAPAPRISSSIVPPSRRRTRVLVVDDDPMIGASIRRVLSSEHDVVVLTDAREALDRIRSGERFEHVLCDLMMPEMSGMDFYEKLLNEAAEQCESVVFLTGGAFTQRAREFLDEVPNPRLEKPFDARALRFIVRGQSEIKLGRE